MDWIENGYITVIPGPTIDDSYIFNDIKNDMTEYKIREFAYDPWGSRALISMLENDFSSNLILIPYSQNLKNLSSPTKQYEKLVYEQKIADTNPVLKWMIQNVAIKPDINGNYKPLKNYKSSNKRIDGVITSIISLDRVIANNHNNDILSFEDIMSLI
jgi:phage terminase large subunit-like protein